MGGVSGLEILGIIVAAVLLALASYYGNLGLGDRSRKKRDDDEKP